MLARQQEFARQEGQLEWQRAALARAAGIRVTSEGQLQAARESLTKCPLRLEPFENINQRMTAILKLSVASGLKIDEIGPGNPTIDAYYQTVPIDLTGKGSFPNAVAFLRTLRQQFPDTVVGSLRITRGTTDTSPIGTFAFHLKWHALPKTTSPIRQSASLDERPPVMASNK